MKTSLKPLGALVSLSKDVCSHIKRENADKARSAKGSTYEIYYYGGFYYCH